MPTITLTHPLERLIWRGHVATSGSRIIPEETAVATVTLW